MKQAIAIIDLSISSLIIINVDDDLDHKGIEEVLKEKGFRLNVCSWGAFDGNVMDLRP